ncbi:Mobile element protein [Methanosarcina sp. WH1]|nr:Mobile element protein [Methanosarcina sp. WH1]
MEATQAGIILSRKTCKSYQMKLGLKSDWLTIHHILRNTIQQKGKPTKRPTMRWIFFNFQGIKELIYQKKGQIESKILNVEEVHWKILRLMGEKYENICL